MNRIKEKERLSFCSLGLVDFNNQMNLRLREGADFVHHP